MEKLSPKHRLFVEAYCGDPVEAVQIAGLSQSPDPRHVKAMADKLMNEPLIIAAIKERSKYMETTRKIIATREQRQELWSNIMFNEDPYRKQEFDVNNLPIKNEANIPLPIRLKASELLGKSEADFTERVEMNQNITLTDIILKSYGKESGKSIEDIEAEYRSIKSAEKRHLKAPVDDLHLSTLDDLI